MANLEGKGNFQGRIWGTFLPLNPDSSDPVEAKRGVTLLARDFQSVAIYASDGSFAGVRRPGSGRPIEVDGLRLVVEDMKGSTGLELKTDPGVPWVYAGFAGLMVTSFLSLLSHSQVWAVQSEGGGGTVLHAGGQEQPGQGGVQVGAGRRAEPASGVHVSLAAGVCHVIPSFAASS